MNFISDNFSIFANVEETKTGYPRILHDGYSYGRRKLKNEQHNSLMHWICTGNKMKKRCCASLVSKMIDGYLMLKVKKSEHICTPKY